MFELAKFVRARRRRAVQVMQGTHGIMQVAAAGLVGPSFIGVTSVVFEGCGFISAFSRKDPWFLIFEPFQKGLGGENTLIKSHRSHKSKNPFCFDFRPVIVVASSIETNVGS
jgi:hypothetical protein